MIHVHLSRSASHLAELARSGRDPTLAQLLLENMPVDAVPENDELADPRVGAEVKKIVEATHTVEYDSFVVQECHLEVRMRSPSVLPCGS